MKSKNVFIFGDTHGISDSFLGQLDSIMKKKGIKRNGPKKDNIVIIAGDCGFCFWSNNYFTDEKYLYRQRYEADRRKLLTKFPFTFICVLGNHENYEYIYSLPKAQIFGGKCFKEPNIENVFYLRNGEVITINNKKIWTFGGGLSIDKEWREEHITWWKDEIRIKDFKKGTKSYSENQIDYIITHDVSNEIFNIIAPMLYLQEKRCPLQDYFSKIKQIKPYKKWFSAHYHPKKILRLNNNKDIVLPICTYINLQEEADLNE